MTDRPISLDLSILSTAKLIEFLFDRQVLDDYADRAKAYTADIIRATPRSPVTFWPAWRAYLKAHR